MRLTRTQLPLISVIIPVKPGRQIIKTLGALQKIAYPQQLVEVIVCRGFNPSKQRNEAAKKAKGEILYFLDDDSIVDNKAFKRIVALFSSKISKIDIPQARGFSFFPKGISKLIIDLFFSGIIYKGGIGAIGGPNVWWGKENFWEALAGAVLESFFVHSQMAARYRPIGAIHRANEKELILCNLAIKRSVFKQAGGFNEVLYPNEENELLNRIEQTGYQLVYHPGVLVYRHRRVSLPGLLIAFWHYGRGRMEQIRLEGRWQSLAMIIPLIFLIYLICLLFYHRGWFWLPLIIYILMALGSSLGFAVRRKKTYLIICLPVIFLLAHLTYAWGLISGLVTNLERKKRYLKKKKTQLILVKKMGKSWQN